jgi:hypothetical protein
LFVRLANNELGLANWRGGVTGTIF